MALAGCDHDARLELIEPTYTVSVFNFAARDRDLKVVTIGNPFAEQGLSDQEFAEFIAESMQGRAWGQPVNFTTTPGETWRENYKVAYAFNPIEPATWVAVCEGDVETGPIEDGVLRVKAAFCQCGRPSGQRVLTGIRARVRADAEPDSEAFQAMMGGITRNLFPNIYRNRSKNCQSILVIC